MNKQKLVVIGNGMAGIRTVEELIRLAPDAYDVTVFGAEPHPNYNRILLSPVLAGEQSVQDIILNDLDWYRDNGIRLHMGSRVVRIDRPRRQVEAADGTVVPYDRLLLATGSRPFMLPIPGADLPGVLGYRDIADTEAMIEAAAKYRHAVVIGGGLLGLEAANGLRLRGMEVSVVHIHEWLMERQLDRPAARLLQKHLEQRGLRFLLRKRTQRIEAGPGGQVASIHFEDGDSVAADLVVMAVGIRADSELAAAAGLHCAGGVVVNDTMQTYDPRIYAVGECVNHRGVGYGLVAPLFEMARVAANHLASMGIARYTGSVTSTKLKVTGIDLFSAGRFDGGDDCDDVLLSDPAAGVYKKVVLKDGRIEGVVLYGDTADGAWYFDMMREKRDVSDIRNQLMLGSRHIGDLGHQGMTLAASMSDEAEVCGCNGVCKGTIVKAIKDKGLFTLEEVRKHTKASASCGSCTGIVEQLLASTLGGTYSPAPKAKAMCGCTDLSHADVRQAIREQRLTSLSAVMHALDWTSADGCSTCRPALNYYLISTWPDDARDDAQSRFINERAHANIQKDGTYSVVPRMWGGMTSSGELRRIADVVDKYQIPAVKVTGGQRIDLLGIRKADLPAIWADLDMPSGHAYGKALRTVKTCVGSEWCRFGTQDSTALGILLEKTFWKMWTPHKVKLAVSGCPRNCAEVAIKDVGIIGVESGWEIYIAGNGGIRTEVAQFFIKLTDEQSVVEHVAAFLQLYREEGFYLERTVHYLERVGLEHVKQKVLQDAAGRRALHDRLIHALTLERDPWVQRSQQGIEAHEFEMLHA